MSVVNPPASGFGIVTDSGTTTFPLSTSTTIVTPAAGLPTTVVRTITTQGSFTSTQPSPSSTCGGCYGVAAVDQLIMGFVSTNHQSTAIAITTRLGQFSWTWTNSISIITTAGFPQNAVLPSADPIDYNGTIIIDPSMINVFEFYQIVAQYSRGNACLTTSLNSSLPTPYSVEIPTSAFGAEIFQAETLFVAQLPGTTCSTGADGGIILGSSTASSSAVPSNQPSTAADSNPTTRRAVAVSVSIVGAVFCVVLVLFLWRLRARRLRTAIKPDIRAELAAQKSSRVGELSSGGFAWQAELHNNGLPQELSTERRAELE